MGAMVQMGQWFGMHHNALHIRIREVRLVAHTDVRVLRWSEDVPPYGEGLTEGQELRSN
jgi:hypothetical protein